MIWNTFISFSVFSNREVISFVTPEDWSLWEENSMAPESLEAEFGA